MPTPGEAAYTIRRAQTLLRTATTMPAAVAEAVADLLDESLAYARLPRHGEYPTAVKGVRLAEAVLAEWGGE